MITFRADKDIEKKLQVAARNLKKTKTEILREALQLYLEDARAGAGKKRKRTTPPAIRESIGVWNGPADSSLNTGQKFGDLLLESNRARRV